MAGPTTGQTWPPASSGGGGTTILSGTETPADDLGSTGNYYLDTDDHILYGPKSAPATIQSVFTTQIPNSQTDTYAVTLGVDITFAVDMTIQKLKWYKPSANAVDTHTLRVWNTTTQIQLVSATTTTETGAGWKTATLAAPLPVVAGQKVRVCLDIGPYQTYSFIAPSLTLPFTNGNLTLNACWINTSNVNLYPATSVTDKLLFIDVDAGGPTIWPVAVFGVPKGGTTGQFLKKTGSSDYQVGWVT